jgi:ribonucleoside-diphosphate reductase alpha chain
MPHEATTEDVARAYRQAYDLGCIGITVFRDGCKDTQVLHVGTQKESPKAEVPAVATPAGIAATPAEKAGVELRATVKPRPRTLRGVTYRMETPMGVAYIHVNQNEAGEPFEVFANVGKGGSDTAAVSESIGRLVSLILRLPSPLSPRERVEQIVSQLGGIGGRRDQGFGKHRVRSLPDAVAQVLAEHIGLAEPGVDAIQAARGSQQRIHGAHDLCPDCGHHTLVFEEGCQKCYSCGYSEC